MPEMISKVEHEYAGHRLKVGDTFEVELLHVPLMLALGRAEQKKADAISTDRSSREVLSLSSRRRVR